jgi:hypothetical protein
LAFRKRCIGTVPAPIDLQVDPFFLALRAKPLLEGDDETLAESIVRERQGEEAEALHLHRLLCASGKRPCSCSTAD